MNDWQCARCAEYAQCPICEEKKPLQSFSDSVVHNRTDQSRKSRCIDCTNPVCSNRTTCPTCTVCRDTKCAGGSTCSGNIRPLHHLDSTLPKNIQELRSYKCARCAERMQCAICEEEKPLQSFSASVLHHRSDKSRQSRCVDCTNPVCSNRATCTTCTVCRDTKCDGGSACKGQIKPLHHSDSTLPKTPEEVRSFKCARCLYPPCRSCGKAMPTGKVRKRFKDSKKAEWLCGECQTLEESRETFRKYGTKKK